MEGNMPDSCVVRADRVEANSMTPRLPEDPDAITRAVDAAILGVGESVVARYRREGLLVEERGGRRLYSSAEVESVRDDPRLTGRETAAILGVSHNRVSQLAKAYKIPVHLTPSGQRVYRRQQIEVVARARFETIARAARMKR